MTASCEDSGPERAGWPQPCAESRWSGSAPLLSPIAVGRVVVVLGAHGW